MNRVYEKVAAVGLDVHYKFSQVTMRDADGRIVRRERLAHEDRQSLRQRVSQWPAGVPMVMEASFGWGWLSDELAGQGLQVELSNCYKLEQMRKARGWSKTDRKDAALLSLLPFETSEWWKVWRAPPQVRDRRERLRYRMKVVALSTATQNRIRALFHRHGLFPPGSRLYGTEGRGYLAGLCRSGADGQVRLGEGALTQLRGLVRLLDHLRRQQAGLDRSLRRQTEQSQLARRLDGIPGFGPILVQVLVAEIGRIERFRDHRALASYSLLAPIAKDTGQPQPGKPPRGRHLGVRGNLTLKWAFIEAARGAVRKGGRWRKMFDGYTDGGKRDRNRGYIKVARALVKVVEVVWRKGVEYTDRPRVRAARRQRAREFLGADRSGTGESYHPMAVGR